MNTTSYLLTSLFLAQAGLLSAQTGASAPGSTRELLLAATDHTKDSRARCEAMKALGDSKDETVRYILTKAIMDPDAGVQSCASIIAGETRNPQAVDLLLKNVKGYLAAGSGEKSVIPRLAAINSIWALGEIGSKGIALELREFYRTPDTTLKINNLIGMGKQHGDAAAAAFIKSVALSPEEAGAVRAAAFEMLEEMGEKLTVPGLALSADIGIPPGDIIYSGGLTGEINEWVSPDLPVGHSGILVGTEAGNGRIYVLIGDCVPGFFTPPDVRNIKAWKNFTHQFKYPYYGNKTTSPAPTAEQRAKIVALSLELGTKGYKYDYTHISQKGPVKFDCVGYSEYIYESAGLNPTDNSYESGLGWPLTPWEQYSSLVSGKSRAVVVSPFPPASEVPAVPAEMLKKGLFGAAGEPAKANIIIEPEPAK